MKLSRKLIDPALLLEDLGEEPYIWTDTDAEIQEHSDWLRFKEMIERQPTVDAVEIPDCNKCAFNDGIAYWHQCENCLGNARNNFVSISEVNKDGK